MKQRFRVLLHGQNFQSETEPIISFFATRFIDAADSVIAASIAKTNVIQELKDRHIREVQNTRLDIHDIGPVSWMRHRIWGSGNGFTFYEVRGGDRDEGEDLKVIATGRTDLVKAATYGFSIFASLGWLISWIMFGDLFLSEPDAISKSISDPKLIFGFILIPGAMTGISIWVPGYLRRKGRIYAALFVAVSSAILYLSCGQIRGG